MLELKNVSFLVDAEGKDKEIIRNVSLTVPDRKLVVVTGPNGGGKSTLARLIAGIEKPTEGRIFFNGEDITDLGVTDRARKGIAYAFQQPVRFKGIRVLDLIRIDPGAGPDPHRGGKDAFRLGRLHVSVLRRAVRPGLRGP